ncbi:MAG: enoyl-CoA hydratase [Alphaproteobacteria bacterium]|nr:enoyl-CoA hydratase [Alphaproteobacteria bacterium]
MTAAAKPASGDAEPILLRRADGPVLTLTLNRPRARNALSDALVAELQRTLDSVATDDRVRVVILAGNGGVFCSGHDLKETRANDTVAVHQAVFAATARLMQTITSLPKPVIASVAGLATAGGCQLVATCDLVVAAEAARFAVPGVNIGLFCSTPMVALGRAIGRKAAMEMLLTGDSIDAATAKSLGLVNRVVPAADLDAATLALARQIAAKSPTAIAMGKPAFHRQAGMDLGAAYDFACRVMAENMMTEDADEGVRALLEKRTPIWSGR